MLLFCLIILCQVYGDDRIPMSQVLSDLVQPVIGGKVDMAMVEYSDKVYSSHVGILCTVW